MDAARDARGARWLPYSLLALANLFWAGNWVMARGMRDAFGPVTLSCARWCIAALVLAPFVLPALRGKWPLIRSHAPVLLGLSFTGVVLFQTLVYLGLRSTTAVNAVLINSSAPLFMLACSWVMERERATAPQVAGMVLSIAGVLVILARGDAANLLDFRIHPGDAWILLAMPVWGVYSVLLKRLPAALGGTALVFVIAAAGLPFLVPAMLFEISLVPPAVLTWPLVLGILYLALFASIGSFISWNRGVAAVGPNVASFFMPLLPAFGTILAMVFLGESFQLFHLAGIVTIVAGVVIATRPAARRAR